MQGCLVVCSCRSAALTCLVLLPIPRVPVPNQVTRVIGIRMQLGQHLLPAGGTGSGLWGAPGLPQMGEKGQVELASSSCASLSKKSAEFLSPECSRHPHLPSQPSTRDSKILLTPQLAPPPSPCWDSGQSPSSRQAVVGIQTFWLHVVNCGGKRAIRNVTTGSGTSGCVIKLQGPGRGVHPLPLGPLTLDLVEVAGLFLGQKIGVGILAGIHLVHKQGAEPAALSIP